MYLNFYQLSKKPFSLAPDPEFLYLSQQHKDALGAIIYGIKEREGFVSVVGEVGTGKTTIVRSYLHKTDRNQILPIFIFNSRITFSELMETFLNEIGIDAEVIQRMHTVNDMVRLAYQAMLEKTSQGKNLVLIIDEAQNMPIETLGNLCILSNFETAKAKLIQIVLVGQPELQKKLDLYELRQLRQRVAYRAQITPLSIKESIGYLHHRLSLSSKGQRPIFTTSAIRRIVKHSKGVPRVINILCENSLVAGYGLQKKPVSLKLVKQVIAEYEGKRFPAQFQLKNVAGSMLILLLTALLVASYLPSPPNSPEESMGERVHVKISPRPHQQPVRSNDRALSSSKKVVKQVEDEIPILVRNAQTIPAPDDPKTTNFSAENSQPQSREPLTLTHLPDVSREPSTTSNDRAPSSNKKVVKQIEDEIPILVRNAQTIPAPDESQSTNFSAETSQPQPREPLTLTHVPDGSREPPTTSAEKKKSLRPKAESVSPLSAGRYITSKQSSPLKIVKRGDTISKLCLDTYGFYSSRILSWLKRHNPHISNMAEIKIDEIVFFPEIEPSLVLHKHQRANSRSSTTKEEVVLK